MNRKTLLTIVVLAALVWFLFGRRREGFRAGQYTRIGVGFDYPGNDLSEMDGNANACAAACDQNSACIGFIRSPKNPRNHCWLKSGLQNGSPAGSRNTFVKESLRQSLIQVQPIVGISTNEV